MSRKERCELCMYACMCVCMYVLANKMHRCAERQEAFGRAGKSGVSCVYVYMHVCTHVCMYALDPHMLHAFMVRSHTHMYTDTHTYTPVKFASGCFSRILDPHMLHACMECSHTHTCTHTHTHKIAPVKFASGCFSRILDPHMLHAFSSCRPK